MSLQTDSSPLKLSDLNTCWGLEGKTFQFLTRIRESQNEREAGLFFFFKCHVHHLESPDVPCDTLEELKHGNISKLKNRQYSEEKKTGIYTLISSIRRGNYCTRVSRKFSSRLKFIQLRFQHRFRFHVEGN